MENKEPRVCLRCLESTKKIEELYEEISRLNSLKYSEEDIREVYQARWSAEEWLNEYQVFMGKFMAGIESRWPDRYKALLGDFPDASITADDLFEHVFFDVGGGES